MAELRAFTGVRYSPALSASLPLVVSAPYDIMSPAAQADYYGRAPQNAVRLELGLQYPTDTGDDNRYTRAASTYRDFWRDGVLQPEASPGMYLYDEEFTSQGTQLKRRSILAAVRLAKWEEKVVFPHEDTLPRAKADRLSLLAATRTQFSPLLATYDDPGTILRAIEGVTSARPLVEFELPPGSVAAAATMHRLWHLGDSAIVQSIVSTLADRPLYIADGHHRYETALAYRDLGRARGAGASSPSEYVLMALVATTDSGLLVLPTHRLVRGLANVDRARVLDALHRTFEVEHRWIDSASPPEDAGPWTDAPSTVSADRGTSPQPSIVALGLLPDQMVRLSLRGDIDLSRLLPDDPPVLWGLDTLILQRLVFEAALGLSRDEAHEGDRIQYTRDPGEAMAAFASGEAQFVFFLSSTPMARIREATRAGVRMPQKTTYFYPKPVTGLVFFDHSVAW